MKDKQPKVVHDCRQTLKWMIPQIEKFPRLRRYTLGERIESKLLLVLEGCIEAAFSKPAKKGEALEMASLNLNLALHLWRLAFELKAVAPNSYGHGSKQLVALGDQIGGWQRYLEQR